MRHLRVWLSGLVLQWSLRDDLRLGYLGRRIELLPEYLHQERHLPGRALVGRRTNDFHFIVGFG